MCSKCWLEFRMRTIAYGLLLSRFIYLSVTVPCLIFKLVQNQALMSSRMLHIRSINVESSKGAHLSRKEYATRATSGCISSHAARLCSGSGKLQIMAVLDSFSILKCACVTISRQTVRQFRLKKDTRRVRPRDIDSPSPH